MKQESSRSFLEQFSNSKKNVSNWPAWMRESSGVAVASLPVSTDKDRHTGSDSQRDKTGQGGSRQR